MKIVIKIVAGSILFFFLVFRPLQASVLAAVAIHNDLNSQDKIKLLSQATTIDPCEENIIDELGKDYLLSGNKTMAAVTFGKGMLCSPANSLMRFKFGEALLIMGYNGIPDLKDAMKLEPNNPVYMSEMDKITKLLSQSR